MLGTSLTSLSMKKDQRINVMLTAAEVQLLEDVLHEERRRSVSALTRDLVREALVARGKAVPAEAVE
jgi:hypothetical protein